ncbi:MAG: Skp family chaperone for outer membrane protein [Pirellulaceae bacterium]|jgi:Skp family chaperone for outer membrane proteins
MLPRRFLATCELLSVLGALLPIAGCQKSQPVADSHRKGDGSTGRVAVIDLDEVATRLGCTEEISAETTRQTAAVNRQMTKLQTLARAESSETQNLATSESTDSPRNSVALDASQLKQVGGQLIGQLINAKRNAERQLSKHRETLVNKFREEVKPFVFEFAKRRGLTVIVTEREFLYSADPSVEITDEAIGEMAKWRRGRTSHLALLRSPQQRAKRRCKLDAAWGDSFPKFTVATEIYGIKTEASMRFLPNLLAFPCFFPFDARFEPSPATTISTRLV